MGGSESTEKQFGIYKKNSNITGSSKLGETDILRSNYLTEDEELLERPFSHPDCATILDILLVTKNKNLHRPWLGTRAQTEDGSLGEFKWRSFKRVFDDIENCAKGLLELDMLSETECNGNSYKFVGIYAKNREEYLISEIAGHYLGATIVPLYDTLGLEGLEYIINETQLKILFTSAEGLSKIYKMENHGILSLLEEIIVYENISVELTARLAEKFAQLRLTPYEELLNKGARTNKELREEMRAKGDTVGVLLYTSGTTGKPKGAMLTHQNMLAGAGGQSYNHYMRRLTNNDNYISYLPMAHALERILLLQGYIFGFKIGFFNGDITKLAADFVDIKPTTFGSVPRLYYRFYALLKHKMSELSGFKKKLLDKALNSKLERVRKTGNPRHKLYDILVFKKMKGVLGGKVEYLASGGAPIDPVVLEFLKVCFCCSIMEGYGQTESFASGSSGAIEDNILGHCGAPMVCTEMKLIDVPNMDYYTTDFGLWKGEMVHMPRGELLLRGPNVFKGYYNNPQMTKATIIDEWLYTGDIAKFLPGGRVAIIDRKLNFFKLSQGEFIAVEKLENIYSMSPFINQIFVYGDGFRDYLVAIVVPVENRLLTRAKALGLKEDLEELSKNEEIIREVTDSLNELANAKSFNKLEYIKKISMILEPFSIENDILTPTLKIKRREAKRIYLPLIEQLYSL